MAAFLFALLPMFLCCLVQAEEGVQAEDAKPAAGGEQTATDAEAKSAGQPKLSPAVVKFFENDVRPLLAARCYKCHGEKKQQSGLRVDGRGHLLAGGETAAAIVPGHPEQSLLLEAVRYESYEMPPDGKLADDEIAVLERWIKLGAPWPGDMSELPAAVKRGPRFTAADRDYWFFQPLEQPPVPPVAADARVHNPIDNFVLRRLEQENLPPAGPADRETLLRRATFDLWGLPPTPEQIETFLADTSEQAYAQMIDRLLESPRYGERWARHWLDLVRYADSNGYKSDEYRPEAWRYRDWVIQSLNEDKPYDRFVTEQLAGDEIAPWDPEVVVATGFLRHWPYESNQRDVRKQWGDILNDVTDVTADVFLGLGFSCARCHDHKFDPILQKDYYRLQAFFAPIWPRTDRPLATAEQREKLAAWEAATVSLREQIAEIERPHRQSVGRGAVEKFPKEIRDMIRTPRPERDPLQHQLAELAYRQVTPSFKSVPDRIKGEDKQRWLALKKELASFDHLKPRDLPSAFMVTDVGSEAPPTLIPGKSRTGEIDPGLLTILDPAPAEIEPVPTKTDTTGRRTALARWMTRPDNQLTTRVMVNRIWQYHFDRGLVPTASDFGRLGEAPSHPELLDWLAAEFVRQGWSIKQMHRLIMNSATYRQTALREPPPGAMTKDPENRLLWKANVRRLDAEQIRDAVLATSGELKFDRHGPSRDWKVPVRSIYLKVLRNVRDDLLDAFDVPDAFGSIARRNTTTTANQALLMINGQWMIKRADQFAKRLRSLGATPAEQVQAGYRLAYGREPNSEELQHALAFLRVQTERIANPSRSPAQAEESDLAEIPGLRLSQESKLSRQGVVLSNRGSRDRLLVPDAASLPAEDFTIEAVVYLRSLDEGARVRVIASQWSGNNSQRGWCFGVTSKKSRYEPRNLILQLVGKAGGKAVHYEVVPSNLRPELNRPYYVAGSVEIKETGEAGITFYMKDLSSDAPLETAAAGHRVEGDYRSTAPLVIGNRADGQGHGWEGLIGNVRLSAAALDRDELLLARASGQGDLLQESTVGLWRFADDARPGSDGSPHENDIAWNARRVASGSGTSSGSSAAQALVDFCHALLNSNEFLYVD